MNKLLPNIKNNRELFEVTKGNLLENFTWDYSVRDSIFHFKFLLFRFFVAPVFSADFKDGHPLLPGLEIYKTIEYGKKNKLNIEYLDSPLGVSTAKALKLET